MPTSILTAPRLVLVRMAEADDTPDEELVKRAQAGDRAALDRLVRRHQRALFALCLRYVRDVDEAADLVQRSFVRAMAKNVLPTRGPSLMLWPGLDRSGNRSGSRTTPPARGLGLMIPASATS